MILVTGASGFLGRCLVPLLRSRGYRVRGVYRGVDMSEAGMVDEAISVVDIDDCCRKSECFVGIDCVIHLAARVHILNDVSEDPLLEFRAVNRDATLELAKRAIEAGVRRFVFLSSIKVNGEETGDDNSFTAESVPCPSGPYAQSKYEAEIGLTKLFSSVESEVTILRPPLVYGPGVKANFARLMRAVKDGVPLPLGAVHNKRSMIGVDNLADVVIRCVEARQAAGRTFVVSDGEDLSTSGLIRLIAHAMNKPVRLVPVPVPVLRLAGTLVGRGAEVERMCGSLRVNSAETERVLDWQPPVSVEAGIQATVDAFLRGR